jgi:twitching motility protein PilT
MAERRDPPEHDFDSLLAELEARQPTADETADALDPPEGLEDVLQELEAMPRGGEPRAGRPDPPARAHVPPPVPPAGSAPLDLWLARLLERHGSDLLLVTGAPPSIRVDGRVAALAGEPVLDGQDIEAAVLRVLSRHGQQQYREHRIADASLRIAGIGRFRVNLHRERGRPAAAIRALPGRPPRLADLRLPPSVDLLTRLPRGLVLIGGPTGAGKSTTLSAILEEINRRDARHIVVIEDPTEFEHAHQRSIVEHVEIGDDAPDFPTALRAALRQAPDVIVVGEMRDIETVQIAVSAAETGHLVLSTVHSPDVTATIARVADSFPEERQNTVRQGLSVGLAAVLTQMLLPRIGGGLAPAAELLLVGYGARQHIRKNALQHLHQEITLTRRHGSFTFEDSLAHLVRQGLVDREDALARAFHRHELEEALRLGTALPGALTPPPSDAPKR